MSLTTRTATLPGNIKSITISQKPGFGNKIIDITGAVADFFFYESVLSNTITATIAIVDTGFASSSGSNLKDTTSIINQLGLSGGERVDFEIVDNNPSTQGRGTIKLEMYINRIRDVSNNTFKNNYVLDLVSPEFISNERTRVTKRYDGNISDNVQSILTNVLKSDSPSNLAPVIDKTGLNYNFIGNTRKPLYVCTWLASKAVPDGVSESGSSSLGAQAGYFFFQTRERFHFISIDNRFGKVNYNKKIKKFIYNNTGKLPEKQYDINILSYQVKKTVDVQKDMSLGTYNNTSIFFDFFSMDYRVLDYGLVEDQLSGLNNSFYMNIPAKEIIDEPTRLMSHVLDVGTLPEGVSTDQQLAKWKQNPKEPNWRADKTMAQSIMRYNQMFSMQVNITIPGDFEIQAGDLVDCTFRDLSTENNNDGDISGIYMVANVCHRLRPTETFTSLDLIRDTKFSNVKSR